MENYIEDYIDRVSRSNFERFLDGDSVSAILPLMHIVGENGNIIRGLRACAFNGIDVNLDDSTRAEFSKRFCSSQEAVSSRDNWYVSYGYLLTSLGYLYDVVRDSFNLVTASYERLEMLRSIDRLKGDTDTIQRLISVVKEFGCCRGRNNLLGCISDNILPYVELSASRGRDSRLRFEPKLKKVFLDKSLLVPLEAVGAAKKVLEHELNNGVIEIRANGTSHRTTLNKEIIEKRYGTAINKLHELRPHIGVGFDIVETVTLPDLDADPNNPRIFQVALSDMDSITPTNIYDLESTESIDWSLLKTFLIYKYCSDRSAIAQVCDILGVGTNTMMSDIMLKGALSERLSQIHTKELVEKVSGIGNIKAMYLEWRYWVLGKEGGYAFRPPIDAEVFKRALRAGWVNIVYNSSKGLRQGVFTTNIESMYRMYGEDLLRMYPACMGEVYQNLLSEAENKLARYYRRQEDSNGLVSVDVLVEGLNSIKSLPLPFLSSVQFKEPMSVDSAWKYVHKIGREFLDELERRNQSNKSSRSGSTNDDLIVMMAGGLPYDTKSVWRSVYVNNIVSADMFVWVDF